MDSNTTFIKSLITGTKNRSIVWDYLDTNDSLYTRLELEQDEFDHDNSFFAQYNDSYFVLISTTEPLYSEDIRFDPSIGNWGYPEKKGLKLFIIPSTFREVTVISTFSNEEYNEDILRLRNLIKKDFPNSEDIMAQFISENPPCL